MVDDDTSVDGSIWFITVVCCLSKCVAFKILSLSHVLDEERLFRYVGGDCSKTSKSGTPEKDYFSTIKKNAILSFETTWMCLQVIT